MSNIQLAEASNSQSINGGQNIVLQFATSVPYSYGAILNQSQLDADFAGVIVGHIVVSLPSSTGVGDSLYFGAQSGTPIPEPGSWASLASGL